MNFPFVFDCDNAFCAKRAASNTEGHPILPICSNTPLVESSHITDQSAYFPSENPTSCQPRQKFQCSSSQVSNYGNERDRQLRVVRVDDLRQALVSTMVEIVQQIPDSPTPKDIKLLQEAIPHLEEIAQVLQAAVRDEDLLWGFDSLGKFYQGQGLEDLLWLLDRLGRFYQGQRLYDLAEPWFVLCLSVAQAGLGDDHLDVGTTLNNLAGLYYCQGRYGEAELLYLKALELRKRLLGKNHSDVATTLNNLGLLYYAQGRYSEAELLYRQVLEFRTFFLGNNHPDVAATLNNLGLLYYAQGRYSEAEPLYLQALELRKRLLGNNHPDVAATLNNLAGLYNSQGRYQEAQPLYFQALQLSERVLGIYHPNTVIFRKNLSILQAKIRGSNSWWQKLLDFRF